MSVGDGSKKLNRPRPARTRTVLVSTGRVFIRLILSYLMLLSLTTYFQRSLIYHPTRTERLLAKNAGLRQATVDIVVKSADGLDLHGWLTVAGSSRSADEEAVKSIIRAGRPVVLFFPGNAGNRSMRRDQLSLFVQLDVHMLLVDYRGYGENLGTPTEADLARDARAVWNHLTQELGVPPHRIVLYGESLGGGVATRLASELCQEGIEPGGLIIQSTFNSLVAAAQYHFPVLPASLMLVDRFPSDVRIPRVTCPILQIHGEQDSIVPFALGQKLFDVTPAQSSRGISKRQFVMPTTDHNDVYTGDEDLNSPLIQELRGFFDVVAQAPSPTPSPPIPSRAPGNSPVNEPGMLGSIDWTTVMAVMIALLVLGLWRMSRRIGR